MKVRFFCLFLVWTLLLSCTYDGERSITDSQESTISPIVSEMVSTNQTDTGAAEETDVGGSSSVHNRQIYTKIDLTEKYADLHLGDGTAFFSGEKLHIFVPAEKNGDKIPYLHILDNQGEIVDSIAVPQPADIVQLCFAQQLSDGNYVILFKTEGKHNTDNQYLSFMDANGNILRETYLHSYPMVSDIKVFERETPYGASELYLVVAKHDGCIYYYDKQFNEYIVSLLYGADGTLYLQNTNGIYRYQAGEMPYCIHRFQDSGYSRDNDNRQTILIADDRSIYIAEPENRSVYLYKSELIPNTNEAAEIEVYVVGGTAVKGWLERAVFAFNQTHPAYRVKNDYFTPRKDGMVTLLNPQYEAELQELFLYREHPDMLLIGSNRMLWQYYEKDIFGDLHTVADVELLGCITRSYSYHGKLYAVPLMIQMSTLAANRDFIDGALTYEQFFPPCRMSARTKC